jgi:hypothetical protein
MDARREAILEQIRQAFPKKPHVKKALKLARKNDPFYAKRLWINENEFASSTSPPTPSPSNGEGELSEAQRG